MLGETSDRENLIAAVLATAVFIVFSPTFSVPFFYDDVAMLGPRSFVPGPWPGLRAFLGYTYSAQGEYEPLVFLLHWVFFRFSAHALFFCRVTSLALHAANAVLLFRLARRWLSDDLLAGALAALFALYPGHAEVLAVSTFKKHLLVSFFALAILDIQETKRGPAADALAWVFQAAALLCKESALMIPLLAAAAARLRPEKRERRLHAGLFALCALFLLFRAFIVPRHYAVPLGGSWAMNAATSAKCLLWSLAQFPVPWSLNLEHDLRPVASASEATLTLAGAGAAIALALAAWRRDRLAGLGLAWCLLFLLPFINLAPFLNFSLVANRYLYFASAGFFLSAARLAQFSPARRAAPVLLAATAILYASVDSRRLALFADPLALWRQTAALAPDNPRAHMALGGLYAERGLEDEALAEYRRAEALAPSFALSYAGLAQLRAKGGRTEEALSLIDKGLPLIEGSALAPARVRLLLAAKKFPEALAGAEAALRADPADPALHVDRALALSGLKRFDEAEEELLGAAAAKPERTRALGALAELYRERGETSLAIRAYEAVLELEPGRSEVALALAELYAKRGQKEKAARALRRAAAALRESLDAAGKTARPEDAALTRAARRRYLELLSRPGLYSKEGRQ